MRKDQRFIALCTLCTVPVAALSAAPSPAAVTAHDYAAAGKLLESSLGQLIKNETVDPNWIGAGGSFWYRRDGVDGDEYVVFDPRTKVRMRAFDHTKLARELARLSGDSDGTRIDLDAVALSDGFTNLSGTRTDGRTVLCDLEEMKCSEVEPKADIAPGILPSPGHELGVQSVDGQLMLLEIATDHRLAMTSDAETHFGYGVWPEGSLLTIPRRKSGLELPPFQVSWSPDGRFVLAPRIDERHLDATPFVEWVPQDGSLRPIVHSIRSSLTGEQPTRVDWFVFDVRRGTQRPLQFPEEYADGVDGDVLAWVDDRAFVLVRLPASSGAGLAQISASSGEVKILFEESAKTRFHANTHIYSRPNVRVLSGGKRAIWYSESSGWGHLELYDLESGEKLHALTSGEWNVADVLLVDERRGFVYFTGTGREAGRDPYYRHLYKASLDGNDVVLLTDTDADHHFEPEPASQVRALFGAAGSAKKIRPDLGYFVDTYSTVSQPPVTVLRSTDDGSVVASLEHANVNTLENAGYEPPIRRSVKAADGKTDLYTVYFPPRRELAGGKHPVIDAAYGGPQVFVAPRNYMEAISARNPVGEAALSRLGFAVVVVDGRGTPARSTAFRDAGYTEFTQVGIEDHVAAIRQLAELHPEIDLERAGVYGWSWGGTFAAQAILSRGDFYDVAVSGAGVYDYAAMYPGFESFTGVPAYSDDSATRPSPQEKPVNWQPLDITAMADQLRGNLLLVYGDLDENVPQAQLMRLVDSLTKAKRPYDLMVLPNATHAAASDPYVVERTWDYFVEHLLGQDPPWKQPSASDPQGASQ